MSEVKEFTKEEVKAIADRFNAISEVNVFDALDYKGYIHQALDLGIRALEHGQRIAGPAVTIRGSVAPLTMEEVEEVRDFHHLTMNSYVYDGCVVVFEGAGDKYSAKLGEFEARGLQKCGATGVLCDGPVRDTRDLKSIEGLTVFSNGTTLLSSDMRWYYKEYNQIVGLNGTTMDKVRLAPGDWIVGGEDGVMVIPKDILMEVLEDAEHIEELEIGMRRDILSGMPMEEARNIWGRN